MDGPTGKMVHVGAEVVVLLGVTFYLNGQIRSLKNEVRELRVKLDDQSEAVNKHLNNVYVVLDKLQNRPAFPGAPFHGAHPLGPGPMPAGRLSPWPAPSESSSPQRPASESQVGLRQRRSKPTPASVPSKSKRPASVPKTSAKHPPRPAPVRPTPTPEPASVEEEPEEQPDPETLDEELKEELAAMESEEAEVEADETSPLYDDDEEEEDGVSLVKDLQRPTTDLSFVQAAIRQTPRRQRPGQKN